MHVKKEESKPSCMVEALKLQQEGGATLEETDFDIFNMVLAVRGLLSKLDIGSLTLDD